MFFRAFDAVTFSTLLVLCVVLPNAFKEVAAGALLIAGTAGALRGLRSFINSRFVLFYIPAALVTVVYCIVGSQNGAPDQALLEVFIIYIAAPLLWGLALHYALRRYGLERVVNWLVLGAALSVASVAYYFFAYFTIGPEAVEFMIEEPNINLQGGYAAARMYVYGSLIFLLGGLLAAPAVVRSFPIRALLILGCVVVTLTSARGALIISIPLALALAASTGLFSRPGRFAKLLMRSILGTLLAFAAVALAGWILHEVWEIDIMVAVDEVIEKITTRGGAGRSEQFVALVDGIERANAMGEGHGVEVYYTVSDEAPWRYEMVWLASLFRVGVLGSIVYAAPFLYTLAVGGRRLLRDKLTDHERFLFGGFVCAFIASNTNPYIEGVVFQWMYVLPVVYFCGVKLKKASAQHSIHLSPTRQPLV